MLIAILHQLLRRRPARNSTARAPAAVDDERPAGCGWFDSSHELQCGLEVTEHASLDGVANALPLDEWMDLRFGVEREPGLAG